MDLSKYIGETTTYDKKLKLEERKPKSWLKSVSAFANTKGGALIFGVSNDDILVGLEDYQNDSEIISEIIKTRLDPVPNIDLKIFSEEDKNLIVVHIESGMETPYYVIEGGSRTAYIRIGNESVPATSSNLKNLVLKGTNKTYDVLASEHSKNQASFTKLKAMYYQKTKKEFIDSDFESFGLIADNGNLTNAGALLADERLVYHSRVFCTRWNGLDKVNGRMEAIGDAEFEGGLLSLLENAENFVKLHSKKMWRKTDTHRIEYPDYPMRAIQEAIVNAIVHRDYTELGSEVHIDIYDDRLEIYSPGGMFDGTVVQNQNPYKISSKRRNPIICDVFSRMNLMERRGSGLKKIIETYKSEEHYSDELMPVFESTHSSFFVTLKNLNYNVGRDVGKENKENQGFEENVGKDVGRNVGRDYSKKIDKNQRLDEIAAIIKENNKITISELSDILNVSDKTIERDIKKLQDDKRIKRLGNNPKHGYWELIN